MQILDEKEALVIIQKHVLGSKQATMAVAFWGTGAVKELRISQRKKPLTVICNLLHGGTNPAEIRKLMAFRFKAQPKWQAGKR